MKKSLLISSLIAGLFAILLSFANVIFGPLNQDEGWYLYAAKMVSVGKMPYRDFFFTQTPFLPIVYGMFRGMWADWGILGGRFCTAFLGLSAALGTALLAARGVEKKNRWEAGLTAFLLIGCNVWHSYFTAIPKTYALASLMTVIGFLLLGLPVVENRENAGEGEGALCRRKRTAGFIYLRVFFAGMFLACAAMTRLSLGAYLMVAGLFLVIGFRRYGKSWFFFGVGGGIVFVFFAVYIILPNFEQFYFANLFHEQRNGEGIVFMLGSVARLARNYFPICVLMIATVAWIGIRGEGKHFCEKIRKGEYSRLILWSGAFLLPTLIHLMSPFPYDDYQVPVMPLIVAIISALFWNQLEVSERAGKVVLFAIMGIVVLSAGASSFNESWFLVRKDRFWVKTKVIPDTLFLRKVGKEIAEVTDPKLPILTQDLYLAVEADRMVPEGFEMGPFGFFPGMETEEAIKHHVLNHELALRVIHQTKAQLSAVSGYTFSMAAPEMKEVAEEKREELIKAMGRGEETVIPDFGQEHTTLRIYYTGSGAP